MFNVLTKICFQVFLFGWLQTVLFWTSWNMY